MAIEVIPPREVPLAESDGLAVRRTLPTHRRSLIGGWCFLDHYGSEKVASASDAKTGAMSVPPHPHTELQTVSWLFSGEIQHRDSAGNSAIIKPGQCNLMTAGRGISHSENSLAEINSLHGVQLWIALPNAQRLVAPTFEHYEPTPLQIADTQVLVFIGELLGSKSPVKTFSPLVGAEINLAAGAKIEIPLNPNFEYGFLLDHGDLEVSTEREDHSLQQNHLAYLELGNSSITLSSTLGARLILIGGEPLKEQIVMWWNFIGRSHEDILKFLENRLVIFPHR